MFRSCVPHTPFWLQRRPNSRAVSAALIPPRPFFRAEVAGRLTSSELIPMITAMALSIRLRYPLLAPKYPSTSLLCGLEFNSGSVSPTKMPVKRILRRLSVFRRSEVPRIKAVIFPPRQHPRVYLATDVRVEGHDLTFTARSVQLGTKGMSLEHAGQLSLAQPVLLTFALPSACTVRVGAVVWWKRKELVGLRFDPRDHNGHIQEWIQRSAATLHS
jgi:hypothetical protein